jgi:hypothetical protein
MRVCAAPLLLVVLASSFAWAQPVPQPFPRAGSPPTPAGTQPPPAPKPAAPASPVPATTGDVSTQAPTEVALGLPIYPGAQFIASYDAGMGGQRYYIFGTAASFSDLVTYYRNVLKQRGELVFEEPATHMFEVGRFREESMAFPPGVTIKDYTWGNLGGYLNPRIGAQPQRFPTVIQIVPVAPGDR